MFNSNQVRGVILNLQQAGLTPEQISGGVLFAALRIAEAGDMELCRATEIAAEACITFGMQGAQVPLVIAALENGVKA